MNQPDTALCIHCFSAGVAGGDCPACGEAQAEPQRDRRALPAGLLVGGKYRLGRILGAGGFGITYLAHDQTLQRRVALKEFFPNGLVSRMPDGLRVACHSAEDERKFQRGLERFISEGRYLARFDHPNIVKVIELFQENGSAYMAMEYLDGNTLRTLQRDNGNFSERQVLEIMAFVLDALDCTHQENVIHRDIKPDNIYLTRQGRPRLLDFGGAKQLAVGGEHSVDTVFSPGYAAPEQYFTHSDDIGPWTDVYASGATIFKLLTGRTPPSGLERQAKDQPLDWSDAQVSPPLKEAVERAMRPGHAQRFASAAEFQAALPLSEPAPPPPPPPPPPARDGRKPLLILGGLISVAALAGGITWMQARNDTAMLRDRVRKAVALEGMRDQLSTFYRERGRFPRDFEDMDAPAPVADSELRRVDLSAGELTIELALPGLEGRRLQLRPVGVENGRTKFECWALDVPEEYIPKDVCRSSVK